MVKDIEELGIYVSVPARKKQVVDLSGGRDVKC